MSKAFTRESDDSPDDDLRSSVPQLPPGTRNYITPGGLRVLKERLEELLQRKQAGSGGSEGEQRKIENRIRSLQQILQSVVVAEPPSDKEKVAFGATVTLKRGNEGEEVYRIVGVNESDIDRGDISWISPLARALVGRRAGDKVRFRSPVGEQELQIVSVGYSAA